MVDLGGNFGNDDVVRPEAGGVGEERALKSGFGIDVIIDRSRRGRRDACPTLSPKKLRNIFGVSLSNWRPQIMSVGSTIRAGPA